MALPNAKTVRSMASGSGTVSTTSGSKLLQFSQAQDLKEGAAVIVDPSSGSPQAFTVDTGSGTTWVAAQSAPASLSGKSFNTTDQTGNRGRGTTSPIVPDAVHYVYSANVDDGGAADLYVYVDTVRPVNGVHPYTRDPMISTFVASKTAPAASPFMIPRIFHRVQILEGVLRKDIAGSSDGSTSSPDKRLKAIEDRLYALERYVNGQAGAPAVGAQGVSMTPAQALALGDAVSG
jgi:hypothetical protein